VRSRARWRGTDAAIVVQERNLDGRAKASNRIMFFVPGDVASYYPFAALLFEHGALASALTQAVEQRRALDGDFVVGIGDLLASTDSSTNRASQGLGWIPV